MASDSTCPGQDQISLYSSVLDCMTSYARTFHGLNAVASNALLSNAAGAKAGDIVTCNDFSHTACGRPSDYWITTKGYAGNCSAENIGEGQKSPGQIFAAWMNSPGHRASPNGPVWVMELGGC